jgi:integrase
MSPIESKLGFPDRLLKRKENQATRIELINQDFKTSGIVCRLAINKTSLLIRYTDPNGKRRSISPPNCDLTPPGILAAQNMASIISHALRLRNYSQEWLDLEIYHKTEKVEAIVLTIGTIRSEFPDRWIKYRSGDLESTDRQKSRTLKDYLASLDRLIKTAKLSDNSKFDGTAIKLLLDLHPEGSDKRFRAKEILSIVSTVFGVPYNFKNIGKRPKPKQRELPTMDEIVKAYNSIGDLENVNPISAKYYQWVFGILATYGLRPQEIFAIDRSKSFNPKMDNWLFLDGKLCDGIKTGNRIIPPLLPDWVELFNLKCFPQSPLVNSKLPVKVSKIGQYFSTHKLGIRPYDLRHAYAIRGDKLGKPLVAMSRAMGHDVATHVRIYQRWISIEDQIESFNRTN